MTETLVLQVSARGHVLKSYTFDQAVVRIGRQEKADVFLHHPSVSRAHAEIVRKDGGYLLRDCGSANKTFLNGRRCIVSDLIDGDRVELGRYCISIGLVGGAPERRDREVCAYPTVRMASVPQSPNH